MRFTFWRWRLILYLLLLRANGFPSRRGGIYTEGVVRLPAPAQGPAQRRVEGMLPPAEEAVSDKKYWTSARDGAVTLVLSLLLWLGLLGVFLRVGHVLATSMAQAH